MKTAKSEILTNKEITKYSSRDWFNALQQFHIHMKNILNLQHDFFELETTKTTTKQGKEQIGWALKVNSSDEILCSIDSKWASKKTKLGVTAKQIVNPQTQGEEEQEIHRTELTQPTTSAEELEEPKKKKKTPAFKSKEVEDDEVKEEKEERGQESEIAADNYEGSAVAVLKTYITTLENKVDEMQQAIQILDQRLKFLEGTESVSAPPKL